jgi:hypothetical protein
MKILFLAALLLSGCSSTSQENLDRLFDRLEFDEGEEGCVSIRGEFDINPIPMITTNVSINYRKKVGDGEFTC